MPEGVKIGLESFVNMTVLPSYAVHPDRTSLDCLYFEGNTPGHKLKGVDRFGIYNFTIHESYVHNATGDYTMGNLSYDLIQWEHVNP